MPPLVLSSIISWTSSSPPSLSPSSSITSTLSILSPLVFGYASFYFSFSPILLVPSFRDECSSKDWTADDSLLSLFSIIFWTSLHHLVHPSVSSFSIIWASLFLLLIVCPSKDWTIEETLLPPSCLSSSSGPPLLHHRLCPSCMLLPFGHCPPALFFS